MKKKQQTCHHNTFNLKAHVFGLRLHAYLISHKKSTCKNANATLFCCFVLKKLCLCDMNILMRDFEYRKFMFGDKCTFKAVTTA